MRLDVLVRSAIALAAVLAVGACTGGADAPAATAITRAPSATVAPTPNPTPVPTPASTPSPTQAGPVDRSDPALGIAFEQIPDVTGPQAEAVDTLMQFQVEFWRSRTAGKVSPAIQDLATDDALAQVKDVVTTNKKDGWTTGGKVTSTYGKLSGTERLVVVDLCSDERQATYSKGGTVTSGADLPTARQKVRAEVAVQATGGWAVQTYRPGASC